MRGSVLHWGDSAAALGYVGHPGAGVEWRQAGKPEVRAPTLRALSQAVVGEGRGVASGSSWAHSWKRPFRLLSWRLGQGQACLLVGICEVARHILWRRGSVSVHPSAY